MRLRNRVCQDLPGPNASQTTVLAFVLPASETEKQLLPAAGGRPGHTQRSAASQAPGQGAVPGLRILCMNAFFLNLVQRGHTVPQGLNMEGGESDSPVRWAHSLQEGLSSVGSVLHVGLCRCHHLPPAKVEETTVLHPCPNSSPLPQVWYPEGKGGGGRCEYKYLCSLTF